MTARARRRACDTVQPRETDAVQFDSKALQSLNVNKVGWAEAA